MQLCLDIITSCTYCPSGQLDEEERTVIFRLHCPSQPDLLINLSMTI